MDNQKLSARVEALEGPEREVDAEIALAIGWTCERKRTRTRHGLWLEPGMNAKEVGYCKDPPRFTHSMDAAITVAPENVRKAFLINATPSETQVHFFRDGDGVAGTSNASDPIMATCAAALKARGL